MALVEPHAIPLPSSPHMSMGDISQNTDSMVSIRLSQPQPEPSKISEAVESASTSSDNTVEPETHPRPSAQSRSSFDIMHGVGIVDDDNVWDDEAIIEEPIEDDMKANVVRFSVRPSSWGNSDETAEDFPEVENYRSSRSSSRGSTDSSQVNWSELDNKEEEEQREEGADESTAFLLARLEQENNAIATDPRSAVTKNRQSRMRKGTRPPSIQVLKNLVQNPSEVTKRYSLLPSPPPMTELEFWAALVKDYPHTASRLPTLTTSKIRAGVPPPLRGVVWMSVVGARDQDLADTFDKLSEESSPYENMIGKDIGRSFPGVDMFKEAGGEGQQALAKVLKCFSLYDKEIGYCQGLGFLVGPLLMQMADRDAFCVLVKLMENYDLRSCFMPDLAGLHLRIYQFQQLLNQHMPKLAAKLASLQVEAAYLSQWFLSFFAVTCPLAMLFRIYDVILAEGASETIMRVALSLMRRNEAKLMVQTEFEEVMQLLLSRQLWEPYSFNADDLVNDFVGLTNMVTRESLQKLETTFKEASENDVVAKSTFFPSVAATATSFVGRLWTSSSQTKHTRENSTLSPSGPKHEKRPSAFLKRSASKQSIASTLNSTDVSSEGTGSVGTITTDATTASRVSSGDVLSAHSKSGSMVANRSVSKGDKGLHGQIEDLLTALSEMQREQTLLTSQLQKEREERDEDHRILEDLVKCVRTENNITSTSKADRRQTSPNPLGLSIPTTALSEELNSIVERVDQRLEQHRDLRRSSMLETKQRLRESLLRSKDQLGAEMARSVELTRQLDKQEQESTSLKEQLRDTRTRVQEGFQERQKLEKTIQELKTANRESLAWTDLERPVVKRTETTENNRLSISMSTGSGTSSPGLPSSSGLRELKLNRSSGGTNLAPPSALPSRTSSLATQKILATKDHAPAKEEQMLVELVNAKTSEAVARQELEEVKSRMDALRKMLALPSPTGAIVMPASPSNGVHKTSASEATIVPSSGSTSAGSEPSQTPPASTTGGGFWSWGRKPSGPAKTIATATASEKS